MKLSIERAALMKALGHVQSVVERRNTIPILSNVLLSAEGGALSFSATDLDMEIIDETAAQVATPGQITAPAQVLYEIVRKLPDGAEVELKYAGEDPRLLVSAGRSRFNLPVLPAGDFPVMSSDGLSARISIEAQALARLIDKTRFAISTEETRYYLNGLYLHTVGEGGAAQLRAVATDGHRLALAEMIAPEGSAGVPGVKSVENNLQLKGPERTAGVVIDDGVITTRVKLALAKDPLTKAYEIEVDTHAGRVQLGGWVDSTEMRSAAGRIAASAEGVKDVDNNLDVKH